jgi:hypothetical protein
MGHAIVFRSRNTLFLAMVSPSAALAPAVGADRR